MGDRPKMLTAKQFAAETQISYPVIIKWLKNGEIPKAEQTDFKIWQIPASVAEMFKKEENRPKLGRPPKLAPDDATEDQVEAANTDGKAPKLKPKRRAAKRSPAKKA